jgi:hypothetical protein
MVGAGAGGTGDRMANGMTGLGSEPGGRVATSTRTMSAESDDVEARDDCASEDDALTVESDRLAAGSSSPFKRWLECRRRRRRDVVGILLLLLLLLLLLVVVVVLLPAATLRLLRCDEPVVRERERGERSSSSDKTMRASLSQNETRQKPNAARVGAQFQPKIRFFFFFFFFSNVLSTGRDGVGVGQQSSSMLSAVRSL